MTTTADLITLDTSDGPMPTHRFTPEGTPRGAIVVIQEAFGVTTHIEDVARSFADAGWLSVAPALFHRLDSPVFAYDNFEPVMPAMMSLNAEGLTTDLQATFSFLHGEGLADGQIGIVGFCMGGTVALLAGTLRPLGGAVTFYGGGVAEGRFGLPPLIELAPSLQAPWLGLFGDLDQGIPVDDVERLRGSASSAAVETEVVRYADAEHGFNCNDRPSFNAVASADARRRTLEWFEKHVA